MGVHSSLHGALAAERRLAINDAEPIFGQGQGAFKASAKDLYASRPRSGTFFLWRPWILRRSITNPLLPCRRCRSSSQPLRPTSTRRCFLKLFYVSTLRNPHLTKPHPFSLGGTCIPSLIPDEQGASLSPTSPLHLHLFFAPRPPTQPPAQHERATSPFLSAGLPPCRAPHALGLHAEAPPALALDVLALTNLCVDIVQPVPELPPRDDESRRSLFTRLTASKPALEQLEARLPTRAAASLTCRPRATRTLHKKRAKGPVAPVANSRNVHPAVLRADLVRAQRACPAPLLLLRAQKIAAHLPFPCLLAHPFRFSLI